MALNNIDLSLLPVFAVIWEEKNLSRAAEKLFVSQSAVSHSLKRLRIDFKDDLFVRSSKGVAPTDFAIALAPQIFRLLPEIENIYHSQKKFDPQTVRRDLILSVGDYFSVTMLENFVMQLRKKAPYVQLTCLPMSQVFHPEKFEAGEIHLSITAINIENKSGFHQKELYKDSASVCLRKKHPEIKNMLTMESYLKAKHLIVSNFGSKRGVIDDSIDKMKAKREIATVVASFFDAGRVLRKTDLLLTAPHRICIGLAKQYNLKLCDLPFHFPRRSIAMVWHERTHNDPFHIWVRQLILNIRDE